MEKVINAWGWFVYVYDKPFEASVILHPHRLAASQPSAARPCSPVGFRAGLVEEDFDFGWCGMGEFVRL